jgi:uncharacterized alkaline shock family protein YloU
MSRYKRIPTNVQEGKITYADDIIDGIVLLALDEIPNVELYSTASRKRMKSKSIKVSVEKDGVYVDVTVKTHYLQNVADVAFKIQESIRHNVESMTEYRIASVNVIVNGVTFEELTPPVQPQNEQLASEQVNEVKEVNNK